MNKMRWLGLVGLVVILLIYGATRLFYEGPMGGQGQAPGPLEDESLELFEEATLSYQRSGGFAGLDETWLIYGDGRIVEPNGNETLIEPEQVAQLLVDLEEAGFFQLDPTYEPENPCCDRFTYVLTAQVGERANRMSAVDGVESVPEELWDSLAIVRLFIERNTP
jgi:hypothetical protein